MNFGMTFDFTQGTYILGHYKLLPIVGYKIGSLIIGTHTLA